jgi:hypothetical protein
MAKRKYGDMSGCALCDQDIQWMGREHGWRDRGNNRECVPYLDGRTGEIVQPAKGAKHKPPRWCA